jgi:hypothetical protein
MAQEVTPCDRTGRTFGTLREFIDAAYEDQPLILRRTSDHVPIIIEDNVPVVLRFHFPVSSRWRLTVRRNGDMILVSLQHGAEVVFHNSKIEVLRERML